MNGLMFSLAIMQALRNATCITAGEPVEYDTCDMRPNTQTTPDRLKYTLRNSQLHRTWDTPDPVVWHKRCWTGEGYAVQWMKKVDAGMKSMYPPIFGAIISVPRRHLTARYSTKISCLSEAFFEVLCMLLGDSMEKLRWIGVENRSTIGGGEWIGSFR